jgi:hypothetical protein
LELSNLSKKEKNMGPVNGNVAENELLVQLLDLIAKRGDENIIQSTTEWLYDKNSKVLALLPRFLESLSVNGAPGDLKTALDNLADSESDWITNIPEDGAKITLEVLTDRLKKGADDETWDAIVGVMASMPGEAVDALHPCLDFEKEIKIIKQMFAILKDR